ncbi:hypothetical protein D3C72_2190700 [compost metagenome]
MRVRRLEESLDCQVQGRLVTRLAVLSVIVREVPYLLGALLGDKPSAAGRAGAIARKSIGHILHGYDLATGVECVG